MSFTDEEIATCGRSRSPASPPWAQTGNPTWFHSRSSSTERTSGWEVPDRPSPVPASSGTSGRERQGVAGRRRPGVVRAVRRAIHPGLRHGRSAGGTGRNGRSRSLRAHRTDHLVELEHGGRTCRRRMVRAETDRSRQNRVSAGPGRPTPTSSPRSDSTASVRPASRWFAPPPPRPYRSTSGSTRCFSHDLYSGGT